MAPRKNGQVTDKDLGWKALQRGLDRLREQDPNVEIGLIGKKGAEGHRKSDEGLRVAELGAIHEFGIGVPERSFLRSTFDAKKGPYGGVLTRTLRAELIQHVKMRTTWDLSKSVALRRMGLKVEGDIKARIAQGIPPPNHPITIARKGSSKTLIDSGQLRNSVTSAVTVQKSYGPVQELPPRPRSRGSR